MVGEFRFARFWRGQFRTWCADAPEPSRGIGFDHSLGELASTVQRMMEIAHARGVEIQTVTIQTRKQGIVDRCTEDETAGKTFPGTSFEKCHHKDKSDRKFFAKAGTHRTLLQRGQKVLAVWWTSVSFGYIRPWCWTSKCLNWSPVVYGAVMALTRMPTAQMCERSELTDMRRATCDTATATSLERSPGCCSHKQT